MHRSNTYTVYPVQLLQPRIRPYYPRVGTLSVLDVLGVHPEILMHELTWCGEQADCNSFCSFCSGCRWHTRSLLLQQRRVERIVHCRLLSKGGLLMLISGCPQSH